MTDEPPAPPDERLPAPGRAPSPPPPPDLWTTIDDLWTWLEAHRTQTGDRDRTLLLRLLKLSEEVGETAQAVIGATGQNPRKGTTHTWQDVEAELCDVPSRPWSPCAP
jgi:hypothetical protein